MSAEIVAEVGREVPVLTAFKKGLEMDLLTEPALPVTWNAGRFEGLDSRWNDLSDISRVALNVSTSLGHELPNCPGLQIAAHFALHRENFRPETVARMLNKFQGGGLEQETPLVSRTALMAIVVPVLSVSGLSDQDKLTILALTASLPFLMYASKLEALNFLYRHTAGKVKDRIGEAGASELGRHLNK